MQQAGEPSDQLAVSARQTNENVTPKRAQAKQTSERNIRAATRHRQKKLCGIGCTDTPKHEPASQSACTREPAATCTGPCKIHVEIKNIMRPWSSIPGPLASGRGELTNRAIKNCYIGDTRRPI
jgi:hypothetical protein